MSASDTGEDAPLVQFLSSVPNSESANRPASRTVSLSREASRFIRLSRLLPALASPKRQFLDAHGWRVDTVAEFQIVGWRHRFEDLEQVTCDRHLTDRIGDLAVFDPEAGCAA